jgi:hypothetical protein
MVVNMASASYRGDGSNSTGSMRTEILVGTSKSRAIFGAHDIVAKHRLSCSRVHAAFSLKSLQTKPHREFFPNH